jgi:CHAT domain-containing protein/Flp pilus assembly protein TadD
MLLGCFENRIRDTAFLVVLITALFLIIPSLALVATPPAICHEEADPAYSGNQKNNLARLEPGTAVEKTLAGGATDSYEIHAEAGQFLHAVVDQLGIDVALTLYDPAGKQIATMDSPNGAFGPEQISTVADASGMYRLEIASGDKNAPAGRYRVSASPPRPPTDADRARIAGERAFVEAVQLGGQSSADSRKRAIDKYEETLPLWRAAGDAYEESVALTSIGETYEGFGEPRKALGYYNQALPLARSAGARDAEGTALTNIGEAYDVLGEKQKALDCLSQALPLFRIVGDQLGEGTVLSNLGLVYAFLGEKQKALDYYKQALPLRRAVHDQFGEAATLNNIGQALSYLGEKQEALDYYKQAIPLQQATGDRRGEAITLGNIGSVYGALGQPQKALDYFSQALTLQRAVGDRRGQARTLTNTGAIYNDLGQHQKALDNDSDALSLWQAVGDRRGQAKTFSNIGAAYGNVGEHQKALDYYSQALPLWRAVGDREEEAHTLDDSGFDEAALGDKNRALENYSQALALARETENPVIEARVLSHLMAFWRTAGETSTAVFFGKQAVNKIQLLRADIRDLPAETQQSFLKSKEQIYRDLADLLITQGRLPEAQQVLDLLKDEQYFEFIRRDGQQASSLTAPVTLSQSEEAASRQYEQNAGTFTSIGSEWAALRAKPSRTPEEEKHLTELAERLQQANQQWEKFLNGLYTELGPSKQTQASVENLQQSASGMQRVVRELGAGTVALYTLVGEEKYRVIAVTPSVMVAREYPIKAADLREKVFEFRLAMTNPKSNPRVKAQALYEVLFAPVAKDVEGAKAVTLMWSLDDVLRYVPVSALYDGHQYLVEKYRNSVFTPANVADLTQRANVKAWHGVGMGVSKSYGQFPALPAVPEELRRVIRDKNVPASQGVLPGQVMLDEEFTENNMKKALEYKYPLVHIASHFGFNPGNETNSFLLLGGRDAEGARLTLAEIRQDPEITFADTELLTLSGCDTATQGAEGDGREVDGLGILAEEKGARAVVASLWAVNDTSTGLLMQKFYTAWTTHAGIPKIEALRRAQVAFLRETLRPASSSARRENPDQATYTHPYYWAPFILIGNWR